MKITLTKNEIIEKFNLPLGSDLEIADYAMQTFATVFPTGEKYFKITDDRTLKTSEIIEKMKSKFPVWISSAYENKLDDEFPIPKELTTRYFLKSEEPDTDTLGLSVNEFEKKFDAKLGITLRERLLMELDYFEETGKHLDVKGVTFCSGSRDSGGNVPLVYWRTYGKVYVSWDSMGYYYAKDGVRRAVTL